MGLTNQLPSSRLAQAGVCTSTTRPTAPYEGQMIYTTDLDALEIWNGSSWRSVASTQTTANGGGGHSNIFANSTVGYAATVVSAVRRVQGTEYVFSNLTFYMPPTANTDASDWTSPGSAYKWSYVYIRPSDNKFYISDNAPSAGTNYRTIGGSLVVYLFPIYSSSSTILHFQLDNSKYNIEQASNARSTYRTYETGLGLTNEWGGGNRTTGTVDVTSKIPTTATEIYAGFRFSLGVRSDAGATAFGYGNVQIQNKSNTWTTAYQEEGWFHIKTPSATGSYYLRRISSNVEITLSTKTYNFAALRFAWSVDIGTNDADTGAGIWMKGFNDGNIF